MERALAAGAAARGRKSFGWPRSALAPLSWPGSGLAALSPVRRAARLRLLGDYGFPVSGVPHAAGPAAPRGRAFSGPSGRGISPEPAMEQRRARKILVMAPRGARRRILWAGTSDIGAGGARPWDRLARAQAGLRPAPPLRCGPSGAHPPCGRSPDRGFAARPAVRGRPRRILVWRRRTDERCPARVGPTILG